MMGHTGTWVLVAMLCSSATGLHGQATTPVATTTVRGRVEVIGTDHKDGKRHGTIPGTVVWLTPIGGVLSEATSATTRTDPALNLRLTQKNKSFDPHILVVPAGSLVEFPNRDPFFHNVFSLYDGKRFDLGLYEAGATRSIKFDRAGVSFIFCNIHPQMSAVIIAIKTPYYGMPDKSGAVEIHSVPAGRYRMEIWSENVLPETLKSMVREVNVSEEASSLGTIVFKPARNLLAGHKNMYGVDYDTTDSSNPAYEQPR